MKKLFSRIRVFLIRIGLLAKPVAALAPCDDPNHPAWNDPYMALFGHPDLPRPKKDMRGVITVSSGKKVEWRYSSSDWRNVELCYSVPSSSPLTEAESIECRGKLPPYVRSLHDKYWETYARLCADLDKKRAEEATS